MEAKVVAIIVNFSGKKLYIYIIMMEIQKASLKFMYPAKKNSRIAPAIFQTLSHLTSPYLTKPGLTRPNHIANIKHLFDKKKLSAKWQ